MSDQKTTVSVGFKTDTQALEKAANSVKRLKRELDSVDKPVGRAGGGIADAQHWSPYRGGSSWGQRISAGGPTGMARRAGRTGIAGMAAGFGALGVATGIIGLISHSVSSAKQYLEVLGPLTKQLSIVGHGQERFANSLERTGVAIGKNKVEMARLTQAYVAQAGQQDGAIAGQVRIAGLMAKGMGLDAGMFSSSMGSMAQMGAFGKYGGMSMDRFAAVIADSVARGGMKGREQELFSSIQSLMSNQLSVLTRLSPGADSAMIAALTAMNASGRPGLMGMRGANVLGRMNSAFMNPQNDFGEYFLYNAMGGGDYFDFQMRREQGIFGQGNLSSVLDHLKKSMPGGKERWYAMSKMFGISMDQARSIEGLDLAGNSGFLDMLGQITGGNLENIGPDKLGLMSELYNSTGSKRAGLLKDSRIAGMVSRNKWDSNTDIKTVLQGVAATDFADTQTDNMLTTLVKIEDRISTLGERMIDPLVKILGHLDKFAAEYLTPEVTKETDPLFSPHDGTPIDDGTRSIWPVLKDFFTPDEDKQKAAVRAIQEQGLFGKGAKDVKNQIYDGLQGSVGPVLEGLGNLVSAIGKQFKVDVKITDERTAGDGSATKAAVGR